ncbi:hypothetical protein [Neisseria elongata]|uniref:hypothetical protein n=1 Tax=Neisseria elongata TaxID=495 RepID=UPI001F1EC037|nr:hypothetical protein [Neisseria elongata]
MKRMILRETFARTIPFGEEYVFLVGNHGAVFGFCVLFLLVKGCLKVWMVRDWRDKKQPALCFPNVQAAFSAQSACSSGTANGLASRRMTYRAGY